MLPSEYDKTYNSYGGCDIVATFNDVVIGELQMVSWSISREKAGIYTFGSPNVRAFSRGKRGIAGTLIFTVFDTDVFIDLIKSTISERGYAFFGREWDLASTIPGSKQKIGRPSTPALVSEADGGQQFSRYQDQYGSTTSREPEFASDQQLLNVTRRSDVSDVEYADQLLPFNLTITYSNEYGQVSVQEIFGLELLNEGQSISVDEINIERSFTFVARHVSRMQGLSIRDLRSEYGSGSLGTPAAETQKTGK